MDAEHNMCQGPGPVFPGQDVPGGEGGGAGSQEEEVGSSIG